MSAGRFVLAAAELDNGDICSVRVQPETVLAVFAPGGANVGPAGDPTLPGRYSLNLGNRRKLPFSSRYVSVKFTGALPDGYAPGQTLRIPILKPSVFNAITVGANGTYLGQDIQVVSKVRQAGA